MTILIAALCAVIVLCWLHTRALNSQRHALEDRLDAQAQRHAQDLRRIIDASERADKAWHATVERQHASLVGQLEQERKVAADERSQLLNRIKPDTYHPPVSQPDAVMTPPAVGFEDDDGFWKASESRDELVERLEREMKAARVHS